ncbi:hypothetical protein CYMTET_56175 [Cymbomonas tetramitiformis]|uniref:Uncharacterized protein n=1 Tax=Cymbomonas tetramitiformis TaxID=36881 RepID=A0AAE0BBG1_9CHLO|nr:hypothetical protein CYMTET_56175 [Cymbomonas tetramitiformis]
MGVIIQRTRDAAKMTVAQISREGAVGGGKGGALTTKTLQRGMAREVKQAVLLKEKELRAELAEAERQKEAKVARNIGSDPASMLYTKPLETAGAAVAFPGVLADELVDFTQGASSACNRTHASGNSTTEMPCDDAEDRRHVAGKLLDVDTQLMVMSGADPHGATVDLGVTATSGITTIAMTLPESGLDVAVQGLSEAITFSLQLNQAEGAAEGEVKGAMRCAFWNESLGEYSNVGCTEIPNPAPAGAALYWRSRHVAELPAGLSSAWVLAPGNVTGSCVESFEAEWAEYGGADVGLRKFLSNGSACELALPGNEFGCWWNWTHQIFSGPKCVLAAEQRCYCTHLTDFKALNQIDPESFEPPKIMLLDGNSAPQLAPQRRPEMQSAFVKYGHVKRLQGSGDERQDLVDSAALLTVVLGIMGGAVYLAMVSAIAHVENRRALLNDLTRPRGTGKHSFRLSSCGAWLWTLFVEDRAGEAVTITLKRKRFLRHKRKHGEIANVASHIEQKLRSSGGSLLFPSVRDPRTDANRIKIKADSMVDAKHLQDQQLVNGPWPKAEEQKWSPFPLHRESDEPWCINTDMYSESTLQLFETGTGSPVVEGRHVPSADPGMVPPLRDVHSQLLPGASPAVAARTPSQSPAVTGGNTAGPIVENTSSGDPTNSSVADCGPMARRREYPRGIQRQREEGEEARCPSQDSGSPDSNLGGEEVVQVLTSGKFSSKCPRALFTPPPHAKRVSVNLLSPSHRRKKQTSELPSKSKKLASKARQAPLHQEHNLGYSTQFPMNETADEADDMQRLRRLVATINQKTKLSLAASERSPHQKHAAKSVRRIRSSIRVPTVQSTASLKTWDDHNNSNLSNIPNMKPASIITDHQSHALTWIASGGLMETDVPAESVTPASQAALLGALSVHAASQADHQTRDAQASSPMSTADSPTCGDDLKLYIRTPAPMEPWIDIAAEAQPCEEVKGMADDVSSLGLIHRGPEKARSAHDEQLGKTRESEELKELNEGTFLVVNSEEADFPGLPEAGDLHPPKTTKRMETWMRSQVNTAGQLSKQLRVFIGVAACRILLEGYTRSLMRRPADPSEIAPPPLDPTNAMPVKAKDPTLRRRLWIRLRVRCLYAAPCAMLLESCLRADSVLVGWEGMRRCLDGVWAALGGDDVVGGECDDPTPSSIAGSLSFEYSLQAHESLLNFHAAPHPR